MLIQYATVRKVKYPERGHPTDAGIDFYCPEFTEEFIRDVKGNPKNDHLSYRGDPEGLGNAIIIRPHTNAVLPSGIKIEIPFGFMGLTLNKSGVASKTELLVGAQVIDTFYSGEVHIDLHNVGLEDVEIKPGQKLIQMVIVPAIAAQPILSPEEELYREMKSESYRDEGGFGSTDKKKDKENTTK